MFKVISNQKVDVSKDEYDYYLELEKVFGKDSFSGLIKTNDKGHITSILPPISSTVPVVLILFFQNLMFNQRLRSFEKWINEQESIKFRIEQIEKRLGM